MLGLGDWGVGLAFVLTLAATALCALYGFLNWNEPGPERELAEIAEIGKLEAREKSGSAEGRQ